MDQISWSIYSKLLAWRCHSLFKFIRLLCYWLAMTVAAMQTICKSSHRTLKLRGTNPTWLRRTYDLIPLRAHDSWWGHWYLADTVDTKISSSNTRGVKYTQLTLQPYRPLYHIVTVKPSIVSWKSMGCLNVRACDKLPHMPPHWYISV